MLPDQDGQNTGGGGGGGGESEDPSVSLFREYLRLKTVHPEPDYGTSVTHHQHSIIHISPGVYKSILLLYFKLYQ